MPLRPWTRIQNIRRYYRRLLCQIATDTLASLWGHLVSAGLGVLAAVVNYVVSYKGGVLWTIGVALIPYGIFIGLALVFNAIRAPVKLDNRRAHRVSMVRESARRRISSLQVENAILAHKPKRTPAEQHRFSAAQTALQKIGECGAIALRHLIIHGELIFGQHPPPLPSGMNLEAARSALNDCVTENLATMTMVNQRVYQDYVYRIAPGMASVLDELLY